MRLSLHRSPAIRLRKIRKTGTSTSLDNCPALYVVQGIKLTRRQRRALDHLAPHETAVAVPPDVIDGPGKAD